MITSNSSRRLRIRLFSTIYRLCSQCLSPDNKKGLAISKTKIDSSKPGIKVMDSGSVVVTISGIVRDSVFD